jgi:hypothetical protein
MASFDCGRTVVVIGHEGCVGDRYRIMTLRPANFGCTPTGLTSKTKETVPCVVLRAKPLASMALKKYVSLVGDVRRSGFLRKDLVSILLGLG